jgi:hypothetical protein
MGKRALYSLGGKKNPIPRQKSKKRKRTKNPVSSFHPKDYSTTELRSISKGGRPEAYVYAMRRADVPKSVKQKARTELKRRKKRR